MAGISAPGGGGGLGGAGGLPALGSGGSGGQQQQQLQGRNSALDTMQSIEQALPELSYQQQQQR